MKPVRFYRLARKEFLSAVDVYERQREGRGSRFRAAVERSITSIQQRPEAFPFFERTHFRQFIVPRFPYSIIFREDGELIRIAAIAHAKRRSGYWRRRRPE